MWELDESGRVDLHVYNEATAWTLSSLQLTTEQPCPETEDWDGPTLDGRLVAHELVQDDSFNVRIVLGELTEQEDTEWIARTRWWLRVPDGVLVVATGGEFSWGLTEDIEDDEFTHPVTIPAGDYVVEVHTMLHGVNGWWVVERDDLELPLGSWWRATRGDEPMPGWLQFHLHENADEDPGHEDEWTDWPQARFDRLMDQLEREHWIDWIVRLVPLEGDPPSDPGELDDGMFTWHEVRIPDRCPAGILGDAVNAEDEEEPEPAVPVDVLERFTDAEPVPLDEPVRVPAGQVEHAARVAWFADREVDGELLVDAPDLGHWVEAHVPTDDAFVRTARDGRFRIGFEETVAVHDLLARLRRLGPGLAELPDGATLELVTATAEGEAGRLRLAGTVEAGAWTITHAFPAVSAATLEAALELAAECDGETVALRDEDELEAVREWWRQDGMQRIAPLEVDGLNLGHDEGGRFTLTLGRAVFCVRHGDDWPCVPPDDPMAGLDFDLDEVDPDSDLLEEMEAHDWFDPLLAAPSGREYFDLQDEDLPALVRERSDALVHGLVEAGATPLGNLICSMIPSTVIRGLADKQARWWATIMVAPFMDPIVELYSRFADGHSLTTTTNGSIRTGTTGGTAHWLSVPGATPVDVVAAHLGELDERGVDVPLIRQNLLGLAEAIEEFLERRFQ